MTHSGGSLYKDEGKEGGQGKWTTIRIRVDVKNKLESLRVELGARSVNDVINALIAEYGKSVRSRVKSIVCNDMSEVSASYVGWVRLLIARGLKLSEVPIALEYLTGTLDELRVDRSKCDGDQVHM